MTGKALLQIMEQYEKINRDVLAQNVCNAMKPLGLTYREQCLWLASLCNTTRNTSYSWIAPHRDAKVPLKVLAKMSVELNKDIEELLDMSLEHTSVQLRQKSERPNCVQNVLLCAQTHPEWSARQLAEELDVAEGTVRRHLKHIENKTSLQEKIQNAEQKAGTVQTNAPVKVQER